MELGLDVIGDPVGLELGLADEGSTVGSLLGLRVGLFEGRRVVGLLVGLFVLGASVGNGVASVGNGVIGLRECDRKK